MIYVVGRHPSRKHPGQARFASDGLWVPLLECMWFAAAAVCRWPMCKLAGMVAGVVLALLCRYMRGRMRTMKVRQHCPPGNDSEI